MRIVHRTSKVMQLRARPPTLLQFTLQSTKYMIELVCFLWQARTVVGIFGLNALSEPMPLRCSVT
jgi:hypothetical protein